MEKLGPGSDLDTLQALGLIPDDHFKVIVDAGCGTGRQTIALARQLRSPVHAVDTSERHLSKLACYASELGIEQLIHIHLMDMADIPARFQVVDLLWSECAAYHIGFPRALEIWFDAIRPGGYAVLSELSWLRNPDDVPATVREYFGSGYPEMRTIENNLMIAQSTGYEVLATHLLSRDAWIDGYYDRLKPLANSLLHHPDAAVRTFARQTLDGVRVFDLAEGNYGYVFYILKKPQ